MAEARLRAEIESGRYRPGEYLPSRARLMAELGASEFVIRGALARLSADHLVSGFRGRGYMVCERVSRRHMFVLDVNGEPWYSFGPCVSLFSCAKSLMVAGCRVLCDFDKVDVVYNATPWHLHKPVALAAMLGGKHVLTEVTSVFTVEDAWEMVETAEKTKLHCMQLENCIYGEIEMLTFNLVRQGLLGEVMHAEGAYNHDGRCMANDLYPAYQYWRYDWYRDHAGNPYPTHGLVPLCLTMDINRGDRMDYVVSIDSKNASFAYFMEHGLKKGNPRKGQSLKVGDVNTSLIKTVGGKTIMVQHTVSTPRPYSRIQNVQGTRGIVCDYPYRIALETKCGDNRAHKWMDEKAAEKIRQTYKHPLWKTIGEIAKKMGGHGGMDYIQDARWSYCLRMGLPLDTTVYDLATTSCLCELTEKSAANRSCALDVPDFTRGAWKTAKKMDVVDIDLVHFEV